MSEQYYKVGEEFQVGFSHLKCIEQKEDFADSCKGCFFEESMDCTRVNLHIIGACAKDKRGDKKDVIFIKSE